MSYKTREDVQKRIEEHYKIAEDLGYEVLGVFCQGSWNYGWDLCDEESDVDSKCIVLPKFEDFCLGKKMVSHTHVCENNEHIDLKDLRLYMDCFKKQNVNFVEILFTDFYKVNPKYEKQWNRLVEHREEIARYDIPKAINCMIGMAYEKKKAMCHPYPTLVDKIEKYGFDGKQVSHIVRMSDIMSLYLAGHEYKVCLHPVSEYRAKQLLDIKRNKNISLEEANILVDTEIELMESLRRGLPEIAEFNNWSLDKNKEVEELMDDVCIDCMTINFKSWLLDIREDK